MNPSSTRERGEASLDEARPKYDLFLQYSDDIEGSFISHLKGALVDCRNQFTISNHTNLPAAIQESQIFVPVFSSKYASSVRCLDELVHIMKYCEDKNKKVFPVFFGVDTSDVKNPDGVNPSDVRNQDGLHFKKAFEAHKTNFDPHRVQKWKDALKLAGQRSGEHFKINGDHEEKFIRKIVKKLKTMKNPQQLAVPDIPVGLNSRVEELISKLKSDQQEDRTIVAVLGIGGIGKTTIAAATFNKIAESFDASCFLGDIRHYDSGSDTSMVKLQKKLISGLSKNNKREMICSLLEGVAKITKITISQKILLVLDDVDHFSQLEALGINPKFFKGGSRIIVTTRDKQSLGSLEYVSYNTTFLDRLESIELFTRLTYKQDEPIDTHFVNEIAYHSSGLPLVLKVWSLHFKHIQEREKWQTVLKSIKAIPLTDIHKKLKISYDSLTSEARKLFLDIACFFDGMDKELIVKVLEDKESALFLHSEFQCLDDRGLVIIRSNKSVRMHDVIREMGQEIVRQENEVEPGQRTRLMNRKDVLRVLKESWGTQSVESIRQGHMTVHIDAFRKMNNLRLIRLHDVALCFDPRNCFSPKSTFVCDCDGTSALSFPILKYLEWYKFPFQSINIDMCNVVVVRLTHSGLGILWERPKYLEKLKVLDVSNSYYLTKTGNFNGLENLEYLNFNHCFDLKELDSSIWCLDKLVRLDLSGCKRLKTFPLKMELGKFQSLQTLKLTGCKSIGFQNNEVIKRFISCLKESPITSLKLGDCKIREVPSEVGSMTSLKHLELSFNEICSLPDSLVQLDQLETLELTGCESLQSIPYLPQSICVVQADRCWCLTTLPLNMAALTSLKEVDLSGCSKLGTADPECLMMKLTGLTSLRTLNMSDCNVSQVPSEIVNLVSLKYLDLSGGTFCSLPDSFGNLLQLHHLLIKNCSELTSLPLLPPSLTKIEAWGCESLDVMRSAYSVGIDDDFSKCVLAEYGEASFLSKLQINLSKKEVPTWCHKVFGNTTPGEYMAPDQHLDDRRKICGIILCLKTREYWNGYDLVGELQNKTKGTSCSLKRVESRSYTGMSIMFYPLDSTTLMVEAGDTLAIHFTGACLLGFGVRLIYKEPTTNETTPPIPNHLPRDDDHRLYYYLLYGDDVYKVDHIYDQFSKSDGDDTDNSDGGDLHEVKIPDDANYHPSFDAYHLSN